MERRLDFSARERLEKEEQTSGHTDYLKYIDPVPQKIQEQEDWPCTDRGNTGTGIVRDRERLSCCLHLSPGLVFVR